MYQNITHKQVCLRLCYNLRTLGHFKIMWMYVLNKVTSFKKVLIFSTGAYLNTYGNLDIFGVMSSFRQERVILLALKMTKLCVYITNTCITVKSTRLLSN